MSDCIASLSQIKYDVFIIECPFLLPLARSARRPWSGCGPPARSWARPPPRHVSPALGSCGHAAVVTRTRDQTRRSPAGHVAELEAAAAAQQPRDVDILHVEEGDLLGPRHQAVHPPGGDQVEGPEDIRREAIVGIHPQRNLILNVSRVFSFV